MLIGREILDLLQIRNFQVTYPWLGETELLTVLNVTIVPDDGIFQVVSSAISVGGKTVDLRIVAGDGSNNGEEYEVHIVATTSLFQQNDDCIRFLVQDRCS
jgi:hypothetical protein